MKVVLYFPTKLLHNSTTNAFIISPYFYCYLRMVFRCILGNTVKPKQSSSLKIIFAWHTTRDFSHAKNLNPISSPQHLPLTRLVHIYSKQILAYYFLHGDIIFSFQSLKSVHEWWAVTTSYFARRICGIQLGYGRKTITLELVWSYHSLTVA